MQEIILKIRHFDSGLSKSIFLLNPVPYRQYYKKQNRPRELVTSYSPGEKKVKKNSFISDVLPDQV